VLIPDLKREITPRLQLASQRLGSANIRIVFEPDFLTKATSGDRQ